MQSYEDYNTFVIIYTSKKLIKLPLKDYLLISWVESIYFPQTASDISNVIILHRLYHTITQSTNQQLPTPKMYSALWRQNTELSVMSSHSNAIILLNPI